jgi:hypothetical protein
VSWGHIWPIHGLLNQVTGCTDQHMSWKHLDPEKVSDRHPSCTTIHL